MKPGSVIVDLAALGGGNCEYTVPGEVVVTDNNVTVIGYTDLPNRLAGQSSQLYSTNLVNLSKLITPAKDGQAVLDFDDVIIRNMTVTHAGELMFPPPPIQVSAAPQQQAAPAAAPATKPEKAPKPLWQKLALPVIGVLIYLWASHYAPQEFLNHLTVFMLSCVVGYYVVWNVTHALHTPLMSVTNAISGIIIVGAVIQMSNINGFASFLAFISVFLVSINIFGGFYVTRRMLNMFRKG